MRYAVFASLSLAIAGCDNSSLTPSTDAPAQRSPALTHPKLSVALLGDKIRVDVAKDLASNNALNVIAPPNHADATTIAATAFKADFVLLVTDATQGPLPVHREHSMILRQLGITSIGLLFANTKQLAGMSDAVELLELEELEVREVLSTYDLPGDHVTCFHDTTLPAIAEAQQLVLGLPATRTWLNRQEPRLRPAVTQTTSDHLTSDIYLMAKQESAHAKSLANDDQVAVFINGNARKATVAADSQLVLGSSSPADLLFDGPVACAVGDRFLVIVGGHAIGAGAVTAVKP